MFEVRRATWCVAVLLLASASVAGLLATRLTVRLLDDAPPGFDADACFAPLRPHLGGVRVIEYLTDRDDDEDVMLSLYGAQYALAPAAIVLNTPRTIRKNLLEGCTLVAHFADAGHLQETVAAIETWCRASEVDLQLRQVSPNLCLVQTRRR